MGLFSSKKITYVDSVAYNMAGDEEERPSYIKSLILQNVTSKSTDTIADTIRYGYLGGPQIDLRAFYRWARDNYTTVGLSSAQLGGVVALDEAVIKTQLPTMSGKTTLVQNAQVTDADWTAWAEQYILQNKPQLWATNWASLMLDDGRILIEYEDGTSVTFTPSNFNKNSNYIYILYGYVTGSSTGAKVTGPVVTLSSGASWPSTSGWIVDYDNEGSVNRNLNRVTTVEKSYSDGRPVETDTNTTTSVQSYLNRNSRFTMTEYLSTLGVSRYSERYYMTNASITQTTNTTTTSEVVGGVTVTTKTTVVQDVLNVVRTHRTDYTDTTVSQITNQKVMLYRIGSNANAVLENMIANPTGVSGGFFPPMPVRIDNKFISDTFWPDTYEQTKKAYKKAMNRAKFDDLVESVEDNDNLNDIDFAFVVFGVSLNVKENQCRKYLFKFFERMQTDQIYTDADMASFQVKLTAYNNAIDGWTEGASGFIPALPTLKYNEIKIKTEGTQDVPYDIRLRWVHVASGSGTGKGKTGAVKGDLWFEKMPVQTWDQWTLYSYQNSEEQGTRLTKGDSYRLERIRLYWQTGDNIYVYKDVYGFRHLNYVYNGKAVSIYANEALDDEDESGFIVPLHYDIMKDMSLMASTQMTTACVFIVFNCYKVVKQKWYQRGIFKILFIVVFAIVAAVFTGGAGFGLLGANLAVGSAMGFTGLTAAIAGSVANALAAVVLSQIIGYASTALFGEQFGALIGAVLSFVIFNVAVAFNSPGGLAGFNWGDMLKADNLLKLTDALSQGYSGYMNSVTQGIYNQTQQIQTNYENRSDEIKDLWGQNIGYNNTFFNPSWVTSSVTYSLEGSSTFLHRTLMTGSDIAQMSLDMLTDYTQLNLLLPTAYG